jgi:endonuclease/exonuclease/phosphatase family metal-dependent hydrolase
MSSINKLLVQLSFPLLIVLLLLPPKLEAQTYDTLRLMTYNLLYYRENTSFCTSNNNNASAKDGYMDDIMDHVNPDILVVNEMGGSQTIAPFNLLNNAINQNGRNFWFANSSSNSSQSIINMIYFNQNKLVLESQFAVSKDLSNQDLVRNIDVYTLYYKDSNLVNHQDTTYIHIVAAHLKSSSGSANEQERAKATEALMARLDSMNATGNYFFVGDLNLYDSFEPAYQDLVSYVKPALRFYDPVSAPGTWTNSTFASLHTQSTHTSGGCYAGGGMDNRFDFILASDEVMNDSDKVEYIANSYTVVGQDGMRYDSSLTSPTNNSAPITVINALYNMSDHLPVTVDLKITKPSLTSIKEEKLGIELYYQNPVEDKLSIHLKQGTNKIEQLDLYSLSGKLLSSQKYMGSTLIEFDLSGFSSGLYFLYIRSSDGNRRVEKLMKN